MNGNRPEEQRWLHPGDLKHEFTPHRPREIVEIGGDFYKRPGPAYRRTRLAIQSRWPRAR